MSSSREQLLEQAMQAHAARDLRRAEHLYRQLLASDPRDVDALNRLGLLAQEVGDLAAAATLLNQATALRPDLPMLHNNLGEVLRRRGDLQGAEQSYRRALAINDNYALALSNLGGVLMEQDRADEAIDCLKRSIAARPNFAPSHNNLGHMLVALGRLAEARQGFEKAIASQPNYADAHFNLGLLFLLQGDWERGFAEWEWRWGLASSPRRSARFAEPAWNGQILENQTLLLYAEQGLGDTIQFIRYLPLVGQRLRGANRKIILACPNELVRMLANSVAAFAGESASTTQVVSTSGLSASFDAHVSLMSLPRVFQTTPANVPAVDRYLMALEKEVTAWSQRLRDAMPQNSTSALKVGLAWAGSPTHRNDRQRSIPPHLLMGLVSAAAAGRPIQFVSLQKQVNPPAALPPQELRLIDFTADLRDFADTAALMMNLDLVIGVDTSIVHLAGALGRLVWTMIPYAPDWRWGLSGEQTPWYSTMRLFRQPTRGDWPSVIAQVARGLANLK